MSYRHAVPPGSTVGLAGGGGTRPSQVVASRAPNLAILLTLCGQLILRKISKFDAARCQILMLKCTKFDFRLKPRRESLQRSLNP